MSFRSNRPSDNPWPFRGQRRPLLIVLFVLVLLFLITYASRLNEYRQLINQEISMVAQIENAEERGRQLTHDLEYVKSPEHTEKIAVAEMGLRREHDQVLTVIDAQAPAKAKQVQGAAADSVDAAEVVVAQEEEPANDGEPDDESSVWRQWLSIFKSSGD